jgi:hypothetical protein
MTLALGQEAALNVKLPVALPIDTPYGTAGDTPLLLIVFATLLASTILFLYRNESRY